jgi:hypothetical protein
MREITSCEAKISRTCKLKLNPQGEQEAEEGSSTHISADAFLC